MQNTTYYPAAVANVITHYAQAIARASYDSVVEAGDYSITDNCAKIQYLLSASAQHTSVKSLAVAALNSAEDTVLRECMYTQLMQHA